MLSDLTAEHNGVINSHPQPDRRVPLGVARTLLSLEEKLSLHKTPQHGLQSGPEGVGGWLRSPSQRQRVEYETETPIRSPYSCHLPTAADLQMELAGTIGVMVHLKKEHQKATQQMHREAIAQLAEFERTTRREIEASFEWYLVYIAGFVNAQLRAYAEQTASLKEELRNQHAQRMLLHQQLSEVSDELESKCSELYNVRREMDAKECEHHEVIRALRTQHKVERRQMSKSHKADLKAALDRVKGEQSELLSDLQSQLESLQALHMASLQSREIIRGTGRKIILGASDKGTQTVTGIPAATSSTVVCSATQTLSGASGEFPNLVETYQRRLDAAERNANRQATQCNQLKQRLHEQQKETARLQGQISVLEATSIDSTSMAKELGKLRARLLQLESTAGGKESSHSNNRVRAVTSFLTSTTSTSIASQSSSLHRSQVPPNHTVTTFSAPPSPLAHRHSRETSILDD